LCVGKSKSIKHCVCVCVFVALVIQHAMRRHHIVIRGLSSSTIFSHYRTNGKISEKKGYWT